MNFFWVGGEGDTASRRRVPCVQRVPIVFFGLVHLMRSFLITSTVSETSVMLLGSPSFTPLFR